MSKVADKLRKRTKFPCELPNGETIHVQSPTHSQLTAMRAISDSDSQAWFIIGSSLREEDGAVAYPILAGEGDVDFANRVRDEMDLQLDAQQCLMTAILNSAKSPKQEVIEKNS